MLYNDKASINNSIGRRLVTYHMDGIMSDYVTPVSSRINNFVILRFISMAIAVYNSNTKLSPTLRYTRF